MTAAVAPHRSPAASPAPQRPGPGRPELRVVDRAAVRRRRLRRNAVLASFVAVMAGFFLVAAVHASLVAGQYELDQVRSRIAELKDEQARVEREIEAAQAPSRIDDVARNRLGMVTGEDPGFLPAVRDLGGG